MSPSKVTKSALRQHTQSTTLGVGGLSHGIDGAVTTDCNQRAASAERCCCSLLGNGWQLIGVGEQKRTGSAAEPQRVFDDLADR